MSTYVSHEIDGRRLALWGVPACEQEDVNRTLRDALRRFPIAALIANENRALIPLNAAADRLFDDEALQRDLLDAYAAHPVAQLIRAIDRGCIDEFDSSQTVVFPSGNRYRVRVSAAPEDSSRGSLLLILEPAGRQLLLDDWGFTPREREIAIYLLEGRSTREICCLASIASNTLRTHVRRILEKSGVHSRTAFVARALGIQERGCG